MLVLPWKLREPYQEILHPSLKGKTVWEFKCCGYNNNIKKQNKTKKHSNSTEHYPLCVRMLDS
jgi:hypothetical protein